MTVRSASLALAVALGCSATRPAPDGAEAPDAGGIDAEPELPPLTAGSVRVHYPAGTRTLWIRGSGAGLDWGKGQPMRPGPRDTWTYTFEDLRAAVGWKPVLDDQIPSRGRAYRIDPGASVEIYPRFAATKGTYERRWPKFHSDLLGTDRGIWVYLPPTYVENERARFPVLYVHEGQNLFDAQAAEGGREWELDETLDEAAEAGTIGELIVIGIETAGDDRILELTPTRETMSGRGGAGPKYARMIVEELKPLVDAELRTLPGREATGLFGASYGGLISLWAGVEHAEIFSFVGAMSPASSWDGNVILSFVESTKTRPIRVSKVYLDHGDSGPSNDFADETRLLAHAYRRAGYRDDLTLKHVVEAGASGTVEQWRRRVPAALHFLLGE